MLNISLVDLLNDIRDCNICEKNLPFGPRPIVRASTTAKILIVGQAPGIRVHNSGVPWDDPSGRRLRGWMGLSEEDFYNDKKIAIIPMGFCYPGKGKSGDLPPRSECAEQWHHKLLSRLPNIELTLLVGAYAQMHYCDARYASLTDRVKDWQSFLPNYVPLVHPSPRNRRWLQKNPWFELEVIQFLQKKVKEVLL